MQSDVTRNDLGAVRIHKNVVASIAVLASHEIEGVKRVGGDFRSGFLELLGKKPLSSVKVEFKKDSVKVEIPLVIKYGYNIPDVSSRVQENVRSNLEKMTSLNVRDVNVNIQGIEEDKE